MINILFLEQCTSHKSDDGEYASWASEYDFDIIQATPDSLDRFNIGNQDFESYALDIKKGENIYVLVLRYGSGDSFGDSSGKGEIVWAYSDIKLAEIALSQYKLAISEEIDTFDMTIETSYEGAYNRQMSNICNGHFESFESIDIHAITVS